MGRAEGSPSAPGPGVREGSCGSLGRGDGREVFPRACFRLLSRASGLRAGLARPVLHRFGPEGPDSVFDLSLVSGPKPA